MHSHNGDSITLPAAVMGAKVSQPQAEPIPQGNGGNPGLPATPIPRVPGSG